MLVLALFIQDRKKIHLLAPVFVIFFCEIVFIVLIRGRSGIISRVGQIFENF